MTEPKTKNSGGARPGAGRKKMLPEDKKQKRTYALAADVIEFLDQNRPAAQTIEKAVRLYKDKTT